MIATDTNYGTIALAWQELKRRDPRLRIRNAADALGVSEAHLVCAAIAEPQIHPDLSAQLITGSPQEIFALLPDLGEVMALTRNNAVVSEIHGTYGTPRVSKAGGLVNNGMIDLRMDFSHWHYAFAVEMKKGSGALRGLQFFDADGTAVHKIYLTNKSNPEAWDAMLETAGVQQTTDAQELPRFGPAEPRPETQGGAQADASQLRDAWQSMGNVHEFAGLLKRLELRRLDALAAVGQEYAQPVPQGTDSQGTEGTVAHRHILQGAREAGIPIMAFVRSPGCTQIFKGQVHALNLMHGSFNVMDDAFNLHIFESGLSQAWLVRKPTNADTVTSVEIYGPAGELELQFFGVRKDNGPEDPRWRQLAESLVPG